MALTTISPHDAQELIARGAKLIDIRDADEYLREHIPEADLAPLSVLEQSGLPPKLRREQIIFHCQAGKRTSNNADKLAAIAAPAEIFLLEDGIDGWKKAGLPVAVNKSQPLPLMRQVQIAAGGYINYSKHNDDCKYNYFINFNIYFRFTQKHYYRNRHKPKKRMVCKCLCYIKL